MKRLLLAAVLSSGLAGGALADLDAATRALERGDHEAAVAELTPLVNSGDPAAQVLYGDMHMKGQGVIQNHVMAWSWYKLAADAGDVEAQFKVASMYRQGLGIPIDLTMAVDYYRRAAEQNHVEAQATLGLFHLKGLGAKPDRAEAVKWLEKAAEQGNLEAEDAIDELFAVGLLALPDQEPEEKPDPDSEAGRLYYAAVAMMEALAPPLSGSSLTTRGRVRVIANADRSFDVILPRFRLTSADGSTIMVGSTRFINAKRLRKTAEGDARRAYRVDVRLPARIRIRPAHEDLTLSITYAQKKFTGVWIPEIRTMTESDVELADLVIADDRGEITMTAKRLLSTHSMTENAPGNWSGPSRMEISGLSLSVSERGRIATLGSMTVATVATGFDIESYLGIGPTEGTEPQTLEQTLATGIQMALPAGVALDTDFADFTAYGEDGAPLVSLAKLAFGIKAGELNTPLASFALTYAHDGLEALSAGALKDIDLVRLKPFMPRHASLDIDVQRVPVAKLFEAMGTALSTIMIQAMAASVGGGQEAAEALALQAASGMQTSLAQAETRVVIELSLDTDKASLDVDGLFNADEAALYGATGGFDLEIEGFDEILALAAADPGTAFFAIILNAMKEMAVTGTTPEGATVTRFRVDLAADGTVLVNGKEAALPPA